MPERGARCGAGARICSPFPGGSGHRWSGKKTGLRGARWTGTGERRVTPAGAGQETRPGAEPMLVATGVASPRRSAGRRARPLSTLPRKRGRERRQGRASVAMSAQQCCRWSADHGRHAPFGAPPPSFVFSLLSVVAKLGRGRAAGMPALILPRTQCGEGGLAPLRGGGGVRRGGFISDVVQVLQPRPLPPRCCAARCPFPLRGAG